MVDVDVEGKAGGGSGIGDRWLDGMRRVLFDETCSG